MTGRIVRRHSGTVKNIIIVNRVSEGSGAGPLVVFRE
ncbi:hypothetical protein VARIO8X_120037 [Burkholderiales bacterium 8X]|nr:hypothetical protein VARIO8X_120037 [Burkholderiales bacterium 8X]